jgi:hypothetical protein
MKVSDYMQFNHLKNFCDFIHNRKALIDQFSAEYSMQEVKRLFGECLYNFMLESDVSEETANELADELSDAYFTRDMIQRKELAKRTNKFVDGMLTTELLYADDTKKYIFVLPGDMIFVADFDYAELSRRADAGDIDSYESYDLTDGCSYYLDSIYAEDISDALLYLVAHHTVK